MPPKSGPLAPTILVVLGVTGDLAKKKILPALAHLQALKILPKQFKVVGFSRRPWQDSDLRSYAASILKEEPAGEFLEKLHYAQGTFENRASYGDLAAKLKAIDAEWGICSNKLFYLAVPPSSYRPILEHLASSGLTEPCGGDAGWTRVLVEKPFGSDLASAEALDELLCKLFKEEQIYRIDHYLAKEMLQNILVFRFTNDLFRDIWNNRHIARIDISTPETLGVEDRGPFYDSVGTLRDVGQNHLLQMLALITMDYPAGFTAASIRAERARILSHLEPPAPAEIGQSTFRAQFRGYREIRGVAPDSETETYFRAMARLNHPDWQGVPIYMEAGKRMGTQKKEIVITLRHSAPCLCPAGAPHYEDRIIIRSEPREEIVVQFWVKKPGFKFALEERAMEFRLREDNSRRQQYTEEYEKLLLDCIAGDQTLFVSSAEIRPMWRFTDAIRRGWNRGKAPLHEYEPDTQHILHEAHAFFKHNSDALSPRLAHKTIGVVGLGKMGANIARQMMDKDWKVVVWNRTYETAREMEAEGVSPVRTLKELAGALPRPRVLWIMVPAGKAVEEVLFGRDGLAKQLQKDDTVIDAGNSFYKDSVRRAKRLRKLGINFLDAGTSGGPSGARHGAAIMVGGEEKIYRELRPLLESLSTPGGLGRMGEAGAGHFVKMVHNGIEYGMMQAIAEGFAIMKKSAFRLPLRRIASLYDHKSVIESRLVRWLENAFREHGEDLKDISGKVGYTGEGEWTAKTAKQLKVPAPIIESSFKFRVKSQKNPSYMGKILSALRNQFGGHQAKPE